jgi:hypothetical protein
MLKLTCPAACGNFELCLIACPHNVHLDPLAIPICDPSVEKLIDNDEQVVYVVEEQSKQE